MVEVTRKDNYSFDDCCKYSYEFRTDDLIVDFYQSGNRDLYFTCFPRVDKKINSLNIKDTENYILYKLIDNLYKDITDLNRWEHKSFELELNQKKLFNGEYISWESDDYASVYESDNKKRYNYLNIYKEEDEYILEFVNNSDRGIYSIAFNTDRSKYRIFVGCFMTLLSDMSKVTDDYHQIDIDEYLIMKKLIKKRD